MFRWVHRVAAWAVLIVLLASPGAASAIIEFASIATSNASVAFGSTVTFTAGVTPAPGCCSIEIRVNGNTFASQSIAGTQTQATFPVSNLAAGTYSVSAYYPAYPPYDAATSSAITQTIRKANSTSAIVSGANPVALGAPVTFTATVGGPGTNVAEFPVAGSFMFRDGANAIAGCSSVPVVNKAAACTTILAPGTRTITAAYSGDANNNASASSPLFEQVIFDADADFDGDGIPNGVELAQSSNVLVKDNDVFTNGRLFSMQQYRDFLGREGDPGGVDYYTLLLATGPASRETVIESFFNSPEFQGAGSPVARLYFATFLRIPDYAGLLFQVNAFKAGTALPVIANNFTASPEFQATYGALDNAQFVALLYQNILGRTPVQAEIDFHVNRLATGASRGEVLVGFSESPEYQANTAHEVYVTMMYVGMLRRAPDPGGYAFWTGYIDAGNSGLALILGFLHAPEYRNRFLP